MSGRKSKATEGVALVIEDGQRWMDDAAAEDDLVTENLYMPGTVSSGSHTKRVLPLASETSTKGRQLLVVPSTTNGKVTVKPAWYGVAQVESGSSSSPQIVLAGTKRLSADYSSLIAAGGGVARWDLIYMTIARATTVTGARLKRDSSDVETTQTVDLADEVSFTIGKVSSTTSSAAALALLPADSTTAWNFPLAVIVVASGYTSGSAIGQTSASSTYITQQWSSAGISRDRIAELRPADYSGVNAAHQSTTVDLTTARWQGKVEISAFLKLKNADNNTQFTLDASCDWRGRFVTFKAWRGLYAGGLCAPAESSASWAGYSGAVNGIAFGLLARAGYAASSSAVVGAYLYLTAGNGDGTDLQIGIGADDTTGALVLTLRPTVNSVQKTFVVFDNVNGDNWAFFVEGSPQLVLNT